MSQWELKGKTTNLPKARENARDQVKQKQSRNKAIPYYFRHSIENFFYKMLESDWFFSIVRQTKGFDVC